jgi:hypothetical protein
VAQCTVCKGSGVCQKCNGKGCGQCATKRAVSGGWGGTFGNGDCAACKGKGQK